ncbi:MATE family efflux transporter [uncultured Anaerococcus sp.]|uniref:MATE family efflux transporter n=1 Tax=uncultured Anaerococcus sp. TaxID=293428 RepID=UPI0028898C09|nr:MATE family efflux transporter [uncultured Anaerococcus sp.]
MNRKIDLLHGNIRHTLLKLSLPLALTAFIQIAYGFVDTIWIARLGTNAVAGVGIAGFIFWIGNSIVLIPKVGMGVYASQSFGSQREDETVMIINNGFIQALIMGLCFTTFCLIVKNVFIEFYHLGLEAEMAAKDYFFVVSLGMIFFFVGPMFTQAFTSLGDSFTPFVINAVGLAINMVLDPVLIFGLGPFPHMGAKGAALATIISQFVVVLIYFLVVISKDGIIKSAISYIDYRENWQLEIFRLGLPAALLSGFHASISMVLNRFMSAFGPTPVAVCAIGSQLESISWNTTEGIQVGIQALVAQNYGAENKERVKGSIKESFRLVAIIGIIATLVLIIFRHKLFELFTPESKEAIELGANYLFILGLSQGFMAIEIGLAGCFNGMSDTKTPAILGVINNLLRIPIAIVLMPFVGVYGVWIAMSSTSIMKGLAAMTLIYRKVKKYMAG